MEEADVSTKNAAGNEDTAIPLNIDIDAADTVSNITISGVPDGAELSAGTDNGDGTWTLKEGDLDGLTVTPADDSNADFALEVSVSTERNGETATSTDTVNVDVKGVADGVQLKVGAGEARTVQDIEIDNASFEATDHGNNQWDRSVEGWDQTGSTGDWDPNTQLGDGATDGENVAWLNSGSISQTLDATFNVEQGYTLDIDVGNRTDQADATYEIKLYAGDQEVGSISSDDLPVVDGEFVTAQVRVDAGEFGNDFAGNGQPLRIEITKTGGGQLNIDNVRMTTDFEAGGQAEAGADTAVPLEIEAALSDTDGSESVSIIVGGVPDGATLSAGTDNGDGTWSLETDQLDGLTMVAPAGVHGEFDLTVVATSQEDDGASIDQVATLKVEIEDPTPEPVKTEVSGTRGNDNLRTSDDAEIIDAGKGNDTVRAGGGDDDVSGGDGKDTLIGDKGDDTLDGGKQDDKLYGGDGDDVLTGGHGRDHLDGGKGDDTFVLDGANDANDSLKGGAGTDRIVTDDDGDFTLQTFRSNNSVEVVDGGETESSIDGTKKNDSLDFRNAELRNIDEVDAGKGNDRVWGSQGDDTIRGGDGKDTLTGEKGDDVLDGGKQDDKLYGGDGDDVLTGGHGRDQLDGGKGDDTFVLDGANDATDVLKGGAGTDRIVTDDDGDFTLQTFRSNNSVEVVDGGETESDINGTSKNDSLDFRNAELRNIDEVDAGKGNDRVWGSRGDDTIRGGDGKDTLTGEKGDDVLDGGTGDDKLYGGDGDDVLTGGAGRDVLDGGKGDDTFVLDGAGDATDILKGGSGTDRIVTADDGDFTLRSFQSNNSVEVVDGGDTESSINGTTSNDRLDFRNAELKNIDEIDTGKGNDRVWGSNGDDTIRGGDGKDTLTGEKGDDVLDGGTGDDRLYGGDGDDTLIGGAGRDVLDGGAGDDTFVLDGANDLTDSIKGGSGTDTVVQGDDGDFVMRSFRGDNSIEVVDGGETESDILGTSSNDSLDFRNADLRNIDEIDTGAGNDRVWGSDGGDNIDGGAGSDRLYGGDGDDTLLGGDGRDRLEGDDGDDVLDGGADHDQLIGGAGDDTLIGGDGNDRLQGGDGNDTFEGGAGRDVMDGGAGDDLFIFGPGGGADKVSGGNGWLDSVQLQDDSGGGLSADSFTIELTKGSIEQQADDYVKLSDDASGTITLDDGSTLQFDGIERIDW